MNESLALTTAPLEDEPAPVPDAGRHTMVFEPRNVPKAAWIVLFVTPCASLGRWILQDGGSVIFTPSLVRWLGAALFGVVGVLVAVPVAAGG